MNSKAGIIHEPIHNLVLFHPAILRYQVFEDVQKNTFYWSLKYTLQVNIILAYLVLF